MAEASDSSFSNRDFLLSLRDEKTSNWPILLSEIGLKGISGKKNRRRFSRKEKRANKCSSGKKGLKLGLVGAVIWRRLFSQGLERLYFEELER